MTWRFALAILAALVGVLFVLSLLAPEGEQRRAALGLSESIREGDFQAGSALFAEKCASCHGADLRGTDKGPPLLNPVYKPDHHSDLAIRLAVKNGVTAHHWQFGDMPPVPGVTPGQIDDLIAYIRGVQRREGLIEG